MNDAKTQALKDSVELYKATAKKDVEEAKTLREALLQIKQQSNEEHIRIIANKALRLK